MITRVKEKMPWLGDPRRKRSLEPCGHSVGHCLIRFGTRYRPLVYPSSEDALARRPQAEKVARAMWAFGWRQVIRLYLVRKCPGLGGPGGKPSQAVVGIRLAWLSDFFLSRRLLLCSESNAYAIACPSSEMFSIWRCKLFSGGILEIFYGTEKLTPNL